MDRTRSKTMANTALETIREHKGQLVNDGLSRASFFSGVVNSLLVSFVVGRFPQHYWLLHTAYSTVMLPIHTIHLCRKRRGFAVLELCWVTVCRRWTY